MAEDAEFMGQATGNHGGYTDIAGHLLLLVSLLSSLTVSQVTLPLLP